MIQVEILTIVGSRFKLARPPIVMQGGDEQLDRDIGIHPATWGIAQRDRQTYTSPIRSRRLVAPLLEGLDRLEEYKHMRTGPSDQYPYATHVGLTRFCRMYLDAVLSAPDAGVIVLGVK